MSEMVERVARAITVHMMKHAGLWDTLPGEAAQERAIALAIPEALPIARLSVEAMRQPTDEMIDAGRWAAEDDGPEACYTMMIDAALNDDGRV